MAILRGCAAPHTLVCDAVTTSRHTADKLSKPRFVLCPCYYLRLDADTEVPLALSGRAKRADTVRFGDAMSAFDP